MDRKAPDISSSSSRSYGAQMRTTMDRKAPDISSSSSRSYGQAGGEATYLRQSMAHKSNTGGGGGGSPPPCRRDSA